MTPEPREKNWILRAVETNAAIVQLPLVQRWCITYSYAYPTLERHVVLRCVKRYAKKHMSWKDFLEAVDMGRLRLWSLLR